MTPAGSSPSSPWFAISTTTLLPLERLAGGMSRTTIGRTNCLPSGTTNQAAPACWRTPTKRFLPLSMTRVTAPE